MELIDLGVCKAHRFSNDSGRTAIILPGAHYLPIGPLLWFSRLVALNHGWSVLQVWDEDDGTTDPMTWVTDRFEAALEAVEDSEVMVVAKSMTTRAVSLTAPRGIAGVWLTPLMAVPEVMEGLRESTAPTLAIGGSQDPTWNRAAAHLADIEVFEVPGADHSLGTDDARRSLDMLRSVVDRMDLFFSVLER